MDGVSGRRWGAKAALLFAASLGLTACDFDDMVAYLHTAGISVVYFGDNVEPGEDFTIAKKGAKGQGAAGGAAGGAGRTKMVVEHAGERFTVWRYEEKKGGEVSYSIANGDGKILHDRIPEADLRRRMPDLLREIRGRGKAGD